MKNIAVGLAIVFFLAAAGVPVKASLLETANDLHIVTDGNNWLLAVAVFVIVGYLITIVSLVKDWPLAAALKEEGEAKTVETIDASTKTPVKVTSNEMVLSSSRLIAFLGLIGILGMFLGAGFYMLSSLFNAGKVVVDLKEIASFLAVGALIFAPYVANQLKGIFTPFKK